MVDNKNKKKQISDKELKNIPLQGLIALLDTTKGEYEYLQKARDGLHTRVGILIALLSALVSAAFIKDTLGFVELFKSNLVIAHLRVICLSALFISFLVALISYVRIFFSKTYQVFNYNRYTNASETQICELKDHELIISFYQEYARCIQFNQNVFDASIKLYKLGNKWLIITIVCSVCSIIISLIWIIKNLIVNK